MTQLEAVRTYIEANGVITTKEAIKELNWITRLSEYIRILRKKGYDIESVWDHNESRRWVNYIFKGKVGEVAQEYKVLENGQYSIV